MATPVPTIAVVFRNSRLDVDMREGLLLIYLSLAWVVLPFPCGKFSDLNSCARIQERTRRIGSRPLSCILFGRSGGAHTDDRSSRVFESRNCQCAVGLCGGFFRFVSS